MNKRINWIDWAKALGIFFVVLGHMYYPQNFIDIKYIIYGFHMPFFFILSGYLYKQNTNLRRVVQNNIKGLIIPFVLFNIIVCVLFYIPDLFLKIMTKEDFVVYAKNTLKGRQYMFSNACWFLLALFWAKIITYFLFKLKKPLLIIALSIIIAFIGYYIHKVMQFNLYFFISQGLLATPFVIIGYYIKENKILERLFETRFLAIVSIVVLLPIYLFLSPRLGILGFVDCNLTKYPLLGITMALIGSSLFLVLCKFLDSIELKFIQRISFGTIFILATHSYIYRFLLKFLTKEPNILLSFTICVLIMILSYYIIGFIQNKVPILLGSKKPLASVLIH